MYNLLALSALYTYHGIQYTVINNFLAKKIIDHGLNTFINEYFLNNGCSLLYQLENAVTYTVTPLLSCDKDDFKKVCTAVSTQQ